MSSYIKPNLVFAKFKASSSTDIISQLADKLYQNGNVTSGYKDAVLAREKEFPTGLPSQSGKYDVAIPHTDVKYVNQPAIAFASLDNPVEFTNMGDHSQQVQARFVVMLAMKEPHSQVKLLSQLMALFQDEDALAKLWGITNSERLYQELSVRFMKES